MGAEEEYRRKPINSEINIIDRLLNTLEDSNNRLVETVDTLSKSVVEIGIKLSTIPTREEVKDLMEGSKSEVIKKIDEDVKVSQNLSTTIKIYAAIISAVIGLSGLVYGFVRVVADKPVTTIQYTDITKQQQQQHIQRSN